MILNIPENRKQIIEYLKTVSEDDFLNEFVIPYFCSQGFHVYRINVHGPGEHGRDVIFNRHVAMFQDNEFLAAQVKAEKVSTSNVDKFSEQIKRALNVSIAAKAGKPHYAVLINAREHTNDAHAEFYELVDNNPCIKILNQDNVCDLIMSSGIAPESLISKLSLGGTEQFTDEDRKVYDTLMENNPSEVDKLLNHQLKLIRKHISPRLRHMVIDYVYNRWEQDKGWDGTIQPMMWFDDYFDFIDEEQCRYLFDIFDELTSSTPSFKASSYTHSVCRKVTIEMLAKIAEEFVKYCVRLCFNHGRKEKDFLYSKLIELNTSGLVRDKQLIDIMKKLLVFIDLDESKADKKKRDTLYRELYFYVWPEDRERS